MHHIKTLSTTKKQGFRQYLYGYDSTLVKITRAFQRYDVKLKVIFKNLT